MEIIQDIFIVILVIYVRGLHTKIKNLEERHKIHINTHIDGKSDFAERMIKNINDEIKKRNKIL